MNDQANQALVACVKALRQGREAQGNEYFAALMTELPALLGQSNAVQQQQLVALIPRIFAAQQRRDLLAIADLLQFELCHLLANKP